MDGMPKKQIKNKLQKVIMFTKAFDRRNSDPSKNYGVGAVRIIFALKGDEGATNFTIFTDFYLPEVTEMLSCHSPSFGADLGWHSKERMYEDQTAISEECKLTDGPCFYDGTGLGGERLFNLFVAEGEQAMWEELLCSYNYTFNTEYSEMSDTILSLSD
jgi:hypothetical protein